MKRLTGSSFFLLPCTAHQAGGGDERAENKGAKGRRPLKTAVKLWEILAVSGDAMVKRQRERMVEVDGEMRELTTRE